MSAEYPISEDTLVTEDNTETKEQLPTNPNFQRLHQAYQEYLNNEPLAQVNVPLYHGTGSYALRRILHQGFIPRSSTSTLSGDSATSPWTPEDGFAFTSFTPSTPDGLTVAKGYAYQSSREHGLSYTADKFLGSPFLERAKAKLFPDIEETIETEVDRIIKQGSQDSEDEIRDAVRMEKEIQIERLQTPGAFIFDPDSAREMIARLQLLQDQKIEDKGETERLLRMNNILWRRGSSVVQESLKTLSDPQSWLSKRIEQLKKTYSDMIKVYESLPDSERDELEKQFPCIILIEGEGMNLGHEATAFTPEVQVLEKTGPQRIREIIVPESKIPLVQQWIKEEGLGKIPVTPLEFTEIHDIVDSEKSK